MKQHILNGACQEATQWDGSDYKIQHGEIITQVTNRKVRDNLFRVESDKRIVQVSQSILERYFDVYGGD